MIPINPPLSTPLQLVVARQRASLYNMLVDPMRRAAARCAKVWHEKERLDQALMDAVHGLPFCSYMYAMTPDATQISDNASQAGLMPEDFGRDRSHRPYMMGLDPARDMTLSEAYIGFRAGRPSVTAVQRVHRDGLLLGCLGAGFDLRDLPLTREHYQQPGQWSQIKGDPAIRGNVFRQCRVESPLDRKIDMVIPVLEELMIVYGIFHGKLHFSSSRATLWSIKDPFRYQLLNYDELVAPDICLAYPRCDYPGDAMIPKKLIRPILDTFKHLRFADKTIYLRAGSINIFNGLVGLNFSCDGSHYVPYDQFLAKDSEFWEGM